MHRLVSVVDVLLDDLCVDGGERVVHPRLVPADPVRHGDPQVPERLKLFDQLAQLVVLHKQTETVRNMCHL